MLAALLLWNRVPGPSWPRWPARVLMLGLCQPTAICVVATWINGGYGCTPPGTIYWAPVPGSPRTP